MGDSGLNGMRLLVESHNLCRWLWLKAIQPVKKIDQHLQSSLFRVLHLFLHFMPQFPLIRAILKPAELLLERDWVVKEELGGIFENLWDGVLREVEREVCRGIREQEGDILSQSFGEESGKSG